VIDDAMFSIQYYPFPLMQYLFDSSNQSNYRSAQRKPQAVHDGRYYFPSTLSFSMQKNCLFSCSIKKRIVSMNDIDLWMKV